MPREQYSGVRGKQDEVTLRLAGDETLLVQSYQIKASVLTQPAAFSMRLGWSDAVAKLLKKYPPGTPFELRINDVLVQTGRLDGVSVSSQASQIQVKGRDVLAELHDHYVEQEFSITDGTYGEITRKCLEAVGLGDAELAFSNRANRRVVTGGHDPELASPPSADALKLSGGEGSGIVKNYAQAKLGERYFEFLRRHLDRAGLFLWAAADGSFVLSEPNAKQRPLYQLSRIHASPYPASILSESYSNDTTGRYASCRVYVRAGGRKHARSTAAGAHVDQEMVGWGFTKTMVLRDADADSPRKAEFLARRKIAEQRRAGFRLSYKVYEHTTGATTGGKAIWAPDTLVAVRDEKLGFDRAFYIEGVTFDSAPEQTTTLDLLRPEDLVFSDRS